jgi:hypothetical protein
MPERVNAGRILGAAGAVALLVSLFIDWYEPGQSAWDVFEVLDLVLAAIALASLVAIVPAASHGRLAASRLPALGAVALVIVIASLLNHPPPAADRSPEAGLWVALAGATLIALGSALDTTRVSVVITLRRRDEDATRPLPDSGPDETSPLPERGP